jgi:hypothetical protein
MPKIAIIYPNHPYISPCALMVTDRAITSDELTKFLIDNQNCVEFSSCIIYESIDKDDPRRWQADVRNTLGVLKSPTIHADEKKISREINQCKIDSPQICKKK